MFRRDNAVHCSLAAAVCLQLMCPLGLTLLPCADDIEATPAMSPTRDLAAACFFFMTTRCMTFSKVRPAEVALRLTKNGPLIAVGRPSPDVDRTERLLSGTHQLLQSMNSEDREVRCTSLRFAHSCMSTFYAALEDAAVPLRPTLAWLLLDADERIAKAILHAHKAVVVLHLVAPGEDDVELASCKRVRVLIEQGTRGVVLPDLLADWPSAHMAVVAIARRACWIVEPDGAVRVRP